MNTGNTKLESILGGIGILLFGYVLVLLALCVNSYAIFVPGAIVFLFGLVTFKKFDPTVRRSCLGSSLVPLMWLGLLAACIVWNAELLLKLLALFIGSGGTVVRPPRRRSSRTGFLAAVEHGFRRIGLRYKRVYQQIKRRSE